MLIMMLGTFALVQVSIIVNLAQGLQLVNLGFLAGAGPVRLESTAQQLSDRRGRGSLEGLRDVLISEFW